MATTGSRSVALPPATQLVLSHFRTPTMVSTTQANTQEPVQFPMCPLQASQCTRRLFVIKAFHSSVLPAIPARIWLHLSLVL